MAKYDVDLNRQFAALSDPTRRMILARLARGPATVSELAEPYEMSLPAFVGHLRKLETAGLIHTSKQGRIRTCMLSADAFRPVQDWLSEQREIWEGRLDRLDDYITNLMKDREDES